MTEISSQNTCRERGFALRKMHEQRLSVSFHVKLIIVQNKANNPKLIFKNIETLQAIEKAQQEYLKKINGIKEIGFQKLQARKIFSD